jgi:hypothetical protein
MIKRQAIDILIWIHLHDNRLNNFYILLDCIVEMFIRVILFVSSFFVANPVLKICCQESFTQIHT